MIRASPCDYYLKFLVTHPDGYDNNSIRTLIKLHGLDFLGMPHLDRIRSLCTPPTPFYPDDINHHLSQRFLVREHIHSLYHPDDDAICAIKLLDHPRAKELTETMIVTDAPPLWIASALKRVQFRATSRAVQLYKHYYFNTDLVDTTELRAILKLRTYPPGASTDPDTEAYYTEHGQAMKYDMRLSSAGLALTPMARVLTMMRMGFLPSNVQVGRIASVGRLAATIRSADYAITGQSEKSRDFALAAKMLSEMMEAVGDPTADIRGGLSGMILETDASEIPSIERITGGDHTLDLIPSMTPLPEETDGPAPNG